MKRDIIKLHVLATVTRGFFVNLGWLYAGTLFMDQYGGDIYASLSFFSTIATLVLYCTFIAMSMRGSYRTYAAAFALVTLLTATHAVSPTWSQAGLAFCVGMLVIDLTGATMAGNLLQATVSPSIFRRTYQSQISWELGARILCTVIFWGVSRIDHVRLVLPLLLIAAVGHLISLGYIGRFLKKEPRENRNRYRRVWQSAAFVKRNHLVRAALLITIWTYTSKFFSETLYYKVVASEFATQAEIGVFVSQLSFGIIIASLLFRKFVAERLIDKMPPSLLLSILPAGNLVLLAVALAYKPFLPIVGLYTFFMVANRGIQLPVSRQCLVPVPDHAKHSIVTLIFLLSSVAGLATSGIWSVFKDDISINASIYTLILLTLPIFFLLMNVDSHYVRNLWRTYKEHEQGEWIENLWTTPTLALRNRFRRFFNVFDDVIWEDESQLPIVQRELAHRDAIVGLYRSTTREHLSVAVDLHHELLTSTNIQDVREGIALISELALPCFQPVLRSLLSHPSAAVQMLVRKELAVQGLMSQLNFAGLRGHTRKKVKAILLREFAGERRGIVVEKITNLLRHKDRKLVARLVDAINFYADSPMHLTLIWSIIGEAKLELEPIHRHMTSLPYWEAGPIRDLIFVLGLEEALSEEAAHAIERSLKRLESQRFSIWGFERMSESLKSDFLHTLFLEECKLRRTDAVAAVIDSIGELLHGDLAERTILADLHLEVLKRSPHLAAWYQLLDQDYFYRSLRPSRRRPLAALASLARKRGGIRS